MKKHVLLSLKVKVGKEKDRSAQKQMVNKYATEFAKQGQKVFKIAITRRKWNKLKPKHVKKNLRPPWTDTFYQEFLKKNACCTLAFKYQNVKTTDSRKKKSPFFRATAHCTFDGCKAVYSFSKKAGQNQLIKQYVLK